MVDPFGLGANLVTIISAFKDPKDLVNKIRSLNKRQKILDRKGQELLSALR